MWINCDEIVNCLSKKGKFRLKIWENRKPRSCDLRDIRCPAWAFPWLRIYFSGYFLPQDSSSRFKLLEPHSASRAAIVDRVSPSCMKMELMRAISSGLFPSAMQQARADMETANSQDFMMDYHLETIYLNFRAICYKKSPEPSNSEDLKISP